MAVGAVRLAVGGVALLALAGTRGVLRNGTRWPPNSTVLAAGSMAAYQLFFFAAVARTGVAVGTVVTIGSSPVLAGVLGLFLRGERPERRWLMATTLAIAGCGQLIFSGSSVSVEPAGVLLALGAGTAYAVYAVSSKGLLEGRPPDAVMAVVFCLGALFLSPFLFILDLNWLAQARGLVVALHLGLVATAAAYTLFARGLTAVPVATAVTLSLAEPLTAGTLGVLLLGERLTTGAVMGVAFLLVGLVLLTIDGRGVSHPAGPDSTISVV